MRPVSAEFRVTQDFGEGATEGVPASWDVNSGVGYLVALYGDYQPDGHAGTDIGCPVGTPVRAARSGTVLWCDWDVNLPGNDSWGPGGYFDRWGFYKHFGGRLLVVQYALGDLDVYAHLSVFRVRRGQFVNEGDVIALSGASSGGQDNQLGPHLHTERIVDLGYSTGGGLIYGRTDPTTVWGGLSAQGTITSMEDDFLMALTEQQQKDVYWILCTQDGREYLRTQVLKLDTVLDKADGAYMNNTRDAQHVAQMAALGKTLNKDDGGYIVNLVEAIKPDALDPEAAAEAFAALVPEAIAEATLEALGRKLAVTK